MVLLSTSILCATVRLVRSSCFLDQLVHFLLKTPPTAELLLERCNHISDQVTATFSATSSSLTISRLPVVTVLQVATR